MNSLQKLLYDICQNKNINFELVSKNWIAVLQKDNKVRYIAGYKFPLNNHASALVCDDKYALYDVLKKFNIPVAEHHILFNNYNKEEVISYAKKYNFNIVVKSNIGTCGNNMYHTLNEKDLFKHIDELLLKNYSISISPYYEIKNEYRSIILNDKIEVFYGKEKPIVIGDGKKTIYELLLEFNNYYFSKIKPSPKLNRVLNKDEIYEYNWQFNLSKGSRPFLEVNNTLKSNIEKLALEVFKLLNLKFVSIDIIELVSGELLVLEANSGVMMENFIELIPNGKEIATSLYSKVIDEMFK